MVGAIIFLFFFCLGIGLIELFLPFLKKTVYFFPTAFFLGTFFSGTIIFLLTFVFLKTADPLKWATVSFVGLSLLFLPLFFRKTKLNQLFPSNISYFLLLIIYFIFSFWLFNRTFQSNKGQISVASNEYLDFGAHVPLIRSFSKGNNFPPELPFYAEKPIFYYFLFDFTTAILEKAGWSIAFSYNLLSALSLSSLLIMIFYFSQQLFKIKNWLFGLWSCLFFVFTPNLSFLYFPIQKNLAGWLIAIRNHNFYLDNGLTINKFFGGFFNLNVFTNQRHLVFGFGIFFIFVLLLERLLHRRLESKTVVFAGILLGLLPFWHNFVILALAIVFGAVFLLNRKKEIGYIIIIGGIIALPQVVYLGRYTQNQIIFRPGFLMHDNLTLFNLLKFWVYNLGFGLLAMVGGWLVAPKKIKRFVLPFLSLFVIPNIFSFAREPFNDHKFFCLFAIFEAMLCAWFLVWLWQKRHWWRNCALVLFFLLIASGLLDFLVVKNDVWVNFPDIAREPFLTWIEKNTQPNDIFFTNIGIWDPVNFTGRRTFLGRPHYLWAYGADPSERIMEKETVLKGENKEAIFKILNTNQIKFLAYKFGGESFNQNFFKDNFVSVYRDKNWVIYSSVLK